MRVVILGTFIVAMLFASVEGTAEPVDDAHFHQTHHDHADDSHHKWFPDADGSDHDGDSCEHFCHAHVVALSTQISLPNMPKVSNSVTTRFVHTISRGAEAPIPPPNI